MVPERITTNYLERLRMDYRREIDGLRALAVIPVILFHAGFSGFSGGFVGVDVFFVISGYLITTNILAEKNSGTFSIIKFYEQRARRILPALFLVMFVCLPFAWMWLLPNDIRSFSQSLIAVPLFTSNMLFWQTSGYFDSSIELKPLVHTWSLAVEEQYYVFFPAFLMLIWRLGKKCILGLLAGFFVMSLAAAEWGALASPEASFYLLPTRIWELLIGVFIAFYFSSACKFIPTRLFSEFCSITGLVLIIVAVLSFDKQTPYPGFYTLVPTIGAALIIIFARPGIITGWLLGNRLCVGIGLVSYSAYLWHQPLLAFARHRVSYYLGEGLSVSLVFITLVLAYFSWKYVEKPFRNKQHFSRAAIFKMGFIGSLFFVGLGLIGQYSKISEHADTLVPVYGGDTGHTSFHKYVQDRYFQCTPAYIVQDAPSWEGFLRCQQSKSSSDVSIALVGDSHAEHLFLGLAENLQDKNIVYYIENSDPFLGNPVFDKIFKYVLETQSIHTVVFTMRWDLRRLTYPGVGLEVELLKTLHALVGAGKNVYLLGDVPVFSFSAESCKSGRRGANCDLPKKDILKYEEDYLPILINVGNQIPGVHFYELRDLFCEGANCSMARNNVLMYRDYNHLNIPGSQYVGAEIVRRFPELRE
jgi:peptidoglycan/LPS O-acetylase OafA/YrhL